MPAERIDGIKYHLDHESDETVLGIHANLLERHKALMGDIEHITGHLVVRGLLPAEVSPDEEGEPVEDLEA